jgi:hypothetical protein
LAWRSSLTTQPQRKNFFFVVCARAREINTNACRTHARQSPPAARGRTHRTAHRHATSNTTRKKKKHFAGCVFHKQTTALRRKKKKHFAGCVFHKQTTALRRKKKKPPRVRVLAKPAPPPPQKNTNIEISSFFPVTSFMESFSDINQKGRLRF